MTFLGDGTGLLAFASVANAGSSALYQNLGVLSFAMADVNNDSYADIVGVVRGRADATSSPQNFFFVSLGNAGGTYTPLAEAHLLPGANAGSVAVRDFDKDGAIDVVVADPDDNALHVYRGVGDGTFLDGPVLPAGVRPTLAVTGDVNADNWGDIVAVDNPTTGDNARAWVIRQQPGTGDATGPTVTLDRARRPSAVVQGPAVAVAASVIDDGSGVSRVDFFGSNGLIGSATSPPYSVGWDASRWRNGPYTLTARAYDRFENLKTSPGVPVTVANPDTVPPEVDLAPLAGPILSGVVALSATATDANGVGRVEFYGGTTLIGTDASAPSPFTLSWDTATVPAGLYALTAKAYDTAVPPNVATSAPVTVTVDQPPSATASGPASVVAFTAAGATVPLTGSGTDPDLGDALSYRWSEGVLELGTTPVLSPVAALGPHLFTLTVTDSFGLSSTAEVPVTVLDTTSPVVTAPASIGVAATQVLGATGNVPTSAASNLVLGFLAGATAHDDVDPLSVVALPPQAPLGPEGASTDIDATTLFPVGTTPVTFRFTDSSHNIGSAIASITVAPPIGGAVQAAGEAVVATDAANALQPVTVSFAEVQQPGLLTAVVLLPPDAPPLPEGVAFAGPVFDIVTTALVSPPFLVCVQGSYDENSLLAHFENNEWLGLMPEPGSSPGELCGLAESLSPFAAVKAALATQTITFDPLSDKTFGDPPFPVTATTESGLAVSFSIASGPATVDGNIVTITGAGVVTVRASQAGDDTYGPALDVDQSFTVGAAAQTITFGPLANRTFGDPPFGVAGTSSSGLSVAFSIVSGPATIDGSIVTITGVGTVVVRATQPGNGNHAAAPDVDQSFTVEAAAQTITFGPLADKTFGDAPFGVSATASSGLPVAFSIVSGPATIDGPTITITGAGTVTVRASQAGMGNYSAAADVEQSFSVGAAAQTILFGAVAGRTFGDAPFTLSATASSGLPVAFSIASGPATIDGSIVTITGAGAVTVRASQGGNGNYGAAPPVERSFTVAAAIQTITFGSLTNKRLGDPPFSVSATASSGLPVGFSIASGPATIDGNLVTITGAGPVTVRASQAGDANYHPAPDVSRSFTVGLAVQTITFAPLVNKRLGDPPFSVSATASSGLPVSFSIASGPATIEGNLVTITGAGTVTVRASQAGDSTYAPAPDVNRSFTVGYAVQTITFASLTGKRINDPPFAVSATASSGLPVTFSIASGPATIDGNVVTITGTGTVTVRASQAGDSTYAPAPNVNRSFTVSLATQTITFGSLTGKRINDPPFTVGATASSGLPVTFSIASGPATIEGNVITITGIGTVTVRASQAGDSTYAPAPNVNRSFTVSLVVQTITFGSLTSKRINDPPFTVSATASSGLPVTFSIASGPATIDGNLVTITGAGTVTVRASQAGDTTYAPAPNVNRSFTVRLAVQTITFGSLVAKRINDPPFTVSATASSGLPVTFSIASGPATIDGNVVTITGTGTVTVRASQAGDSTYAPAPNVNRSFSVTLAPQTIAFAPLANKRLVDPPFALSALSSSGLPVAFSIVSGPATIEDDVVTLTGTGTVTIRASQGGDDTYGPAPNVNRSFRVTQ